ncbi:YeeE/YedE thiosulfate transporter family protein [uncultured Sulfitobacter sp.]|uniref:YeeE/YedE family protein n=1 Tax=uncultured Sulfitobacter sp. TaxID=191468 RepID=UPI002616696B|nr:YeeE/YedE thiosulfate transporter family protein [uncultured Sulfitobacter sp.]
MPVDWIWGLAGGLMIGCAAALYLLGNGRIMGASGILGGLIDGSARGFVSERIAFLIGVIAMPAVLFALGDTVDTHATGSVPLLIVGGVLVGLGTRVGNGCTSGHGVCGISRLSLRGMVATGFYIGAGVLAVVALRGVL